ncbi:MAG: LarC family nickel insertion protein, partial [Actinomycetota bacterium]
MTLSTGRRTLWLDPAFGAAGDMVLGALIGLGASADEIRAGLADLDVPGWTLEAETAMRCSLSAHRAVVRTEEGHHHRTWSSIDEMLADSALADRVKAGSRATFRRLGEVEAGIHDVSIDEVHFHEVGAVDAIVDIVGSWLALTMLGVDRVICGPIGMGHGTTDAAHGRLPIPAPATAALLIGGEITPVD